MMVLFIGSTCPLGMIGLGEAMLDAVGTADPVEHLGDYANPPDEREVENKSNNFGQLCRRLEKPLLTSTVASPRNQVQALPSL